MTLKQYMFRADLTDHAMGKILGVSHATINRYRNNKLCPSLQRAVEIHECTGGRVTPTYVDWPVLTMTLDPRRHRQIG